MRRIVALFNENDREKWPKWAFRSRFSILGQPPSCKDFGFKDQITRCSLSVPSNIAEGFERDTDKDGNKFFYYAKGSCAELRTQIYIGIEIGYINKETGFLWKNETEQLSKMLFALIKSRST